MNLSLTGSTFMTSKLRVEEAIGPTKFTKYNYNNHQTIRLQDITPKMPHNIISVS